MVKAHSNADSQRLPRFNPQAAPSFDLLPIESHICLTSCYRHYCVYVEEQLCTHHGHFQPFSGSVVTN